jgi:hypothetical protein
MTHQFAQVKVRVKSSISGANITALSGVRVEGGQRAMLAPFSGNVGWTGTVTQNVDPFTTLSSTERESGYRTVTPVGTDPVIVTVGSVTVSTNASAFANKWTAFGTTLDPATSYELVVDLRKGSAFAYSNIYWDGSKMAFDVTDKGNQGYQGLFFRWGSLVGVSPAGNWQNNYTRVYKAGEATYSTYPTWNDVPWWDNLIYGNKVGAPNLADLVGDICTYINPAYRLPKMGELGPISDWTMGGNNDYVSGNAEGTTNLLNGSNNWGWAKNSTTGDVTLPASGYLHSPNGDSTPLFIYLIDPGSVGHYSSSESSSSPNGLFFDGSTCTLNAYIHALAALSVRCVRN